MPQRRVVTGHEETGEAVIVSDGPVPRSHAMVSIPGASTSLVWSTEPLDAIPADGADPTAAVTTYVPAVGGTRFIVLTLAPDAIYTSPGFDGARAAAERRESSPGLAELFEPDNPGMHRTPTVDYCIVLEGEVWLDMDEGRLTPLNQGDIVVQNGTRHAWRNKNDQIASIAFVLVGAPTPKTSP